MKRRDFVKLFAVPAAAVAAPAAVVASVKEPESQPEPQEPQRVPVSVVEKVLGREIKLCAIYQERAHNGDDWLSFMKPSGIRDCESCYYGCLRRNKAKAAATKDWNEKAALLGTQIEETAELLGYRTTWPGLYPEFEPILA